MINRKKFKSHNSNDNRDALISEMIRNKVDDLSDTYLFGVPSLYIIEDNHLKDFKIGSQDIGNYYSWLK